MVMGVGDSEAQPGAAGMVLRSGDSEAQPGAIEIVLSSADIAANPGRLGPGRRRGRGMDVPVLPGIDVPISGMVLICR